MPAVPTLGGGKDEVQPIRVGDAAQAIAVTLERADLGGRALEIAGADRTCMNDLIEPIRGITGRDPLTVPITGAWRCSARSSGQVSRLAEDRRGAHHYAGRADIAGSPMSSDDFLAKFRERFSDVAPWAMHTSCEPGTPTTSEHGETLTVALPLRGNVQVEVEELAPQDFLRTERKRESAPVQS